MEHAFDESRETVAFVADVTAATRDRLRLFWFPMLAFGWVSLGAAVVALLMDDVVLGPYWGVIGTAAGVATARHYRRSEEAHGLLQDAWPYLVIVAILGVGVFTIPYVVAEPGWAVSLWTGAAYAAFAALERNGAVACTAVVFLIVGVVFVRIEVAHEMAWIFLITGLALLIGGRVSRPRPVIE